MIKEIIECTAFFIFAVVSVVIVLLKWQDEGNNEE